MRRPLSEPCVKICQLDDLLFWLHDRFPDLTDPTVLRLYHALIERGEWLVTPADLAGALRLNTVRVIHYPHALIHLATAAESSP